MSVDEEKLRAKIEKVVGRTVPEPVWSILRERGWTTDVLRAVDDDDRREAYRYLVKEVRRELRMIEQLGGSADGRSSKGYENPPISTPLTERSTKSTPLAAIVRALMVEACSPAAAEFRARWCGGKTLHPEEVEGWLRSLASAPFEPVEHTAGEGVAIWWRGRAFFAELARCVMERRAALHELHKLVEDICSRFLCGEEAGLLFVLCGQAPPIGVRVKRRWTHPFGVAHFIMEIPVWLEPSEVERLYRQARKDWGLVKRFRPPSPRLARVVCELVNGRQRGESFAEIAERLGMSRNQLADKWHRARKIAIRILTAACDKGGKSLEGAET